LEEEKMSKYYSQEDYEEFLEKLFIEERQKQHIKDYYRGIGDVVCPECKKKLQVRIILKTKEGRFEVV
jgi:uncharacterized protein YlaI